MTTNRHSRRPHVFVAGIVALAGVAGVYTACTAAPPAAQDYWPMKLGNTWTLDTTVGAQKVPQVATVSDVKREGNATLATIKYSGGGRQFSETYRVTSQVVERVSSDMGQGSSPINPPIPIIKYPLTAGKKWDWSGTITTMGRAVNGNSRLTVTGPVSVKTPAGTFKAMRVHSALTVEAGGQKVNLPNDYWFAPGVGMVRQEATIMQTKISGILKSYKLK
jgi:hypothetical protein